MFTAVLRGPLSRTEQAKPFHPGAEITGDLMERDAVTGARMTTPKLEACHFNHTTPVEIF